MQTNQLSAAVDIIDKRSVELPAMFPWPMGELVIPEKGCGLGNPLKTSLKNMAQPWREQIGYWIFVRDSVSHDLVLSAASTMAYFATGASDTAEEPPATTALGGWSQNLSTTNLFAGGAPVPRDFLFAAVALGVSVGRPFAVEVDEGIIYKKRRVYAPWVDTYGARARDLIWSTAGLSVKFKDAACDFELGNIGDYPPHADQYGGETVRSGGGFGLHGMIPIDRGPIYLGAKDESTQATITAKSAPEDLVLEEDDEIATVSSIAVPMKLIAYGDFGPWCGPCAPTPNDMRAAIAAGVAQVLNNMGINPNQLGNGR